MRIAVCVKQVPDPRTAARLDPRSGRLDRSGPAVLDPADAVAVDAALRLGEGITAVSMGPPAAADAVRWALAMGAQAGLLVSDPALAGADLLQTVRVLAAALRRGGFDLIVCSCESTDSSLGAVPAAVAELLGIPAVTWAVELRCEGRRLGARRRLEAEEEVVEVELPALVSVSATPEPARRPTLQGLLGARRKPIEVIDLAGLALDPGARGQEVAEVRALPARHGGEVHPDAGDGGIRIADFLAARGLL